MDADITGPSIPRLLDAADEQAYATKDNEIIPIVTEEGIKIMSLNYLMKMKVILLSGVDQSLQVL